MAIPQMRSGRAAGLAAAVGVAALLAGCVQTTNPDGSPAVAFVGTEVARVALTCAEEDFEPGAVRTRLIADGFVEQQRPGILQLERFPEGAGALTQGVTVPSRRPCSPRVNAVFAQESVDAAGKALIFAGYRPTDDPRIFARGAQQVRLRGSAPELGGVAVIDIELLR